MKIVRDLRAVQFIELSMVEGLKQAQIEAKLEVSKAEIRRWKQEQQQLRNFINKLKQKWRNNAREIPFKQFYDVLADKEECHYCGITQAQIDKLYSEDRLPESGRSKRGRTLEVERLEPKESYANVKNLAWACYWCNNAKSDLFSEEEFKAIGLIIGQVHRARLAK